MLTRSLQPKYARHFMGFPQTDIGALIEALYGIEEGISRGIWSNSSLSYSKGRSHLEDKDMEMLTLLVLLGQDHSSNSKLLHRLLRHLTHHLMHSIGHLLLLILWP